MIYLFRMISDEDQDFFRDVVIDGTDTFLDFHQCIQENLNYDPTLLASFFITNEHWEKQQEITLIDMMEENGLETVTMDQAVIQDYINEITGRMIYVFDFFSERAFFIELIERSDTTTSKKTPFIGHEKGDAPPQLAVDMLEDEEEPGMNGWSNEEEEEREDLWLDDLDLDLQDPDIPDDY
ncbi:MAG TPA: hypothetical protein ENO20_10950 [Bacteroides sp.]|nr:hypothetical protein [Bacteroides sp.]